MTWPLVLLLTLAASTPPPEVIRLAEEGAAALRDGDPSGAAAALEAVRAQGWESAALLVQLAAAYRMQGDLGRARLHAERAARLDPRGAHALAADLAREAGDPPRPPPGLLEALGAWTGRRVGPATLLGLAALGWTVGLLAAASLVRRQRSPRSLRGVVAVGLGTAALAGALALATLRAGPPSQAVVLAPETAVRTTPSLAADTLALLGAGRTVALRGGRDLWRRVRLPNGTSGWAEADALAPL